MLPPAARNPLPTLLGLCLTLLAACSPPAPSLSPTDPAGPASPLAASAPAGTPDSPAVSEATPTGEATTPTPEPPLAVRVNGEGITLENFEQEVARFELGAASVGQDPTTQGNYRATVLETLIQQKVIEQAAIAAGFTVSEAEVQAQTDQAIQARGSEEAFANWLLANLYTEEQFRAALRSQMLAARITESIAVQVPTTVEQVHARHILVPTEDDARSILAQLQNGADFAELALGHSQDLSSRAAGGDLGWFPRGLLTQPEIEEAAFILQPGELSDVIHSELGYHIVQTLERDPARELSPDAHLLSQTRAVARWIQEQLDQATIERLVTP